MSVCGIVCEYNPFHTGHLYHMEKTKRELNTDDIICVMSPNFVQRGEPSLLDKWLRTKYALLNGAAVVLELPTIYATSSAELFAAAAVTTLHRLNIVDHISFGAEDNNLSLMDKVAAIFLYEPVEYKKRLSMALKEGMNFPTARFLALQSVMGEHCDFLKNSNSILAIEYLKALKRLKSPILPFAINRSGSLYNDATLGDKFSSATAIRKNLTNMDKIQLFIPKAIYYDFEMQIKNRNISNFNKLYNIFLYILKTTPADDLANISHISEGFHNRILRESFLCDDFDSLISRLNTKRYTETRIKRMLLNIILNIKKEEVVHFNDKNFIPYVRVLGFRKDKEYLLREMGKSCSVPIITNYKQVMEQDDVIKSMLIRESVFTDIYNLSKENGEVYQKNYEFQQSIVIV